MNVGSAIKLVRLKLGLTHQVVCERSGLTQGFLSRLENGYTDTKTSTLQKIADAFDVPVIVIIHYASSKKDIYEMKKFIDKACIK